MTKKDKNLRLSFVPLDADSIRIVVFTKTSFGSNEDMTSQLGLLSGLVDKISHAKTPHYSGFKKKHVNWSWLVAELFSSARCWLCVHDAEDGFRRLVPMAVHTDSKCLYNALTGFNSNCEKCPLINLTMLCHAFQLREIALSGFFLNVTLQMLWQRTRCLLRWGTKCAQTFYQ